MKTGWLLVATSLLAGCNMAAGLNDLEFDGASPPAATGPGGGGAGAGGAELLCPGGDISSGDSDSDGLCDDIDPCTGPDNASDVDMDGWCDSLDVCVGDDSFGDADGDGLCEDGSDPCFGVGPVDSDLDGTCDDLDICAGPVDNGDGSCTLTIDAAFDDGLAGLMSHSNQPGACPGPINYPGVSNGNDEWTIHRYLGGGNSNTNNAEGYLSFDTRLIAGTIEAATLTVKHVNHFGDDSVELWTSASYPAWTTIGGNAHTKTNVRVGSQTVNDIDNAGWAEFQVSAAHINVDGLSQFRLAMSDCPSATSQGQNHWMMSSPSSATPPRLAVTYRL